MTVGVIARDRQSAEFFEAAGAGVLLIKLCIVCGEASEPEADLCRSCGSDQLVWDESVGTAVVVAVAVTHTKPAGEQSPSRVVVAIVELDEGPWMYAQIVGENRESTIVGSRTSVDFERPEGGEAIPVFRLV